MDHAPTDVQRSVLAHVAGLIRATDTDGPTLVAVDGVDGVGKTLFADALRDLLVAERCPVVRLSMDGFHHRRAHRHARGAGSPEGFFHDSFDLVAFHRAVLRPLAPGGSRLVRTVVFDHRTDTPVDAEPVRVPEDAVVLVDGLFLHRPELRGAWALTVLLQAGFGETFARMAVRDGCPPDPEHPANRRHVEGQRLYLAACVPQERASVVIDNEDVRRPLVVLTR